MHPRPFSISAVVIGALVTTSVFAQSGTKPRFEVASVKANSMFRDDPDTTGVVYLSRGGRLVAQYALLRFIIQSAYRVRPYQMVGGPDWIDSARYDIEGRAATNASSKQLSLMLQSLLEERFKLRVHRETREVPIYTLTQAARGVKMPRTKDGSCKTSTESAPGPEIPSAPGSKSPGLPVCGEPFIGIGPGSGDINGRGSSMAGLINVLSEALGRTIIDKTQLKERYDIHLVFAADQSLEGFGIPDPNAGGLRQATDPRFVSIFTALQEQLGLKLEAGNGPGEVLVIDSVERPTEN
jgi:uncharacterized protein (TIGR03435 family)